MTSLLLSGEKHYYQAQVAVTLRFLMRRRRLSHLRYRALLDIELRGVADGVSDRGSGRVLIVGNPCDGGVLCMKGVNPSPLVVLLRCLMSRTAASVQNRKQQILLTHNVLCSDTIVFPTEVSWRSLNGKA